MIRKKIGIVLATAALAFAVAGAARASVAPSMAVVQCEDGTVWVLDEEWTVDGFGAAVCGGDYTVLQEPDEPAAGGDDGLSVTGGLGLGLGAASNMAPDPAQYATEIQCPNGEIWAVATGDDFVCPTADGF